MQPRLTSNARTETGWVREANEDSFVARSPLFFVADGMGGHSRGDAASRTAIEIMTHRIPAGSLPTPDEVVAAIAEANDRTCDLTEEAEAICGTTLTGVVLVRDPEEQDKRTWMIVNVGDSRVYDWDGTDLTQCTVDHTAVQQLVDAEVISADEARSHPKRSVLTRALGVRDGVEADIRYASVTESRAFVICSDGVTSELTDEQIARILTSSAAEGGPIVDGAWELVEAALSAGGRDNVTAIVVQPDRPIG